MLVFEVVELLDGGLVWFLKCGEEGEGCCGKSKRAGVDVPSC